MKPRIDVAAGVCHGLGAVLAAALAAAFIAPEAAAQVGLFAPVTGHRLEDRDSIRMLIATDGSRPYFRVQNVGPEPRIVHIAIEEYKDPNTGERARRAHDIHLGPFEVGAPVYLDGFAAGPAWVAEWTVEAPPGSPPDTAAPADRDAAPFFRVPPHYPDQCQEAAAPEEIVVARFIVSERGDTKAMRVIRSTNPCFDDAALAAVKQWIYAPKLDGGRAVIRTNVETAIVFQLPDA